MLTKKTPETIKAIASVVCAGETSSLVLTLYNRSTEALSEFTKSGALSDVPDAHKENPLPWMNAQVCLFIIKSFEDGTEKEFPLNIDGLLSMEAHYPGVLMGIIQLFHQVRQAAVEKN